MRRTRRVVCILFAAVAVLAYVLSVEASPQCAPFGSNNVVCNAYNTDGDPNFCDNSVVTVCDAQCQAYYGHGVWRVDYCETGDIWPYIAAFWCDCGA